MINKITFMTALNYRFSIFIFLLIYSTTVFCQDNYELLYLNNNFDQIISIATNKNSMDDYFWLSLILDKKGKSIEAINTLEEGVLKYADNARLEIELANMYYETGIYAKALPYLKKHQANPGLFLKYIVVLEFQEDHNTAIKLLKRELIEDSLNLNYLSHLGDNYFDIDSIELAISYYDKILKQNPNDQSTAKKLASLYLKTKKYAKCVEVCDTILDSDSSNVKFIKYKGMANFNNGNFLDAEACFTFLNNSGDSSKFVLKHLGISEFHNSKFKKSREHLIDAFKLDSNDYETCFFMGKGYLNSPTPEKGIYFYNRVDSLLQADPLIISTLYAEKQSIYSSINKYEEALNCYMLAYKYNPKPEYLFFIASMYQNNLDDKKNAYKYYNLFLEKLPPKPESEHIYDEKQITISLRKVAENNIIKLKEELFFEGELPNLINS